MALKGSIVLLVGPSGSGKTSVCNELAEFFKWKPLESYTTRPPRYEGETGHTFITDEEFDKLEGICAYTKFDGHRYCATQTQVDEADIYVIDPAGVDYFTSHYWGRKFIIPIYLECSEDTRYRRMRERGDSWLKAKRRIWHDRKAFSKFEKEAPVRINAEQELKYVVADIYKTVSMLKSISKVANESQEEDE